MYKIAIFSFLLGYSVLATAQIPLINSGEIIERGKALYDSGKYEDAIREYKKITQADTNYVYMLTELAMTYSGNKQYDEAIKICDEALAEPSEHRYHLLMTKAIALDRKGELAKSIGVFKKAINEFPFFYLFYYNLGITYLNAKEYQLAEKYFQETLQLNPYHSGSHFYLGKLAAMQGKRVRAMLALGLYMAINNNDNEQLVFLERFLNNEYDEDGTVPFSGEYTYDRLDQIIKARIVNEKSFKSRIDFNAVLVRQYQLLFDQLPEPSNDFYGTFYMPLYQQLKAKDLYEPFMFHILTSTNNAIVKKWNSKNQKNLDAFFSEANTHLGKLRSQRKLPQLGYDEPVSVWYKRNNRIDAIGDEKPDETKVGKWFFFADNSVVIAEGSYDNNGNKIGKWVYRYADGHVSREDDYSTGEIRLFSNDGVLTQRYFLKDGLATGDVEFFNPCGDLREKLAYKESKRNGPGKVFYLDGTVETEYEYLNNEREGSYISYYDNGKVFSKALYKVGLLEGAYEEFYIDGKRKLKGSYSNGKATGTWSYYYPNGRLEKEGQYKNDIIFGEWKFYDARGNLTEQKTFSEQGKLQGDLTVYADGKKHYVLTYKNDLLISLAYFDESGKEIYKAGKSDGSFVAKGFFPTGELRYEGNYKKGKADGEWKYYFPHGGIQYLYLYKEDVLQGPAKEYFSTGQLKYDMVYEQGKLHGYFKEFYAHGTVRQEGWLQNGLREQYWREYYVNGALEAEYYYLLGELQGLYKDYDVNGKIYSETDFDKGNIIAIRYFDQSGVEIKGATLTKPTVSYLRKFKNGKPNIKFEMKCGQYISDVVRYFPDGKIYQVGPNKNGRRHGKYQYYLPTGDLEIEGNYENGLLAGKWLWYYDGGRKFSEGHYLNGERDSVWTYYGLNGKISSVVNYLSDERHGIVIIYGTDGNPVLEKRYNNGMLLAYRMIEKGTPGSWIKFSGNDEIKAYFENGKLAYHEKYENGVLQGIRREYYPTGTIYKEHTYKDGDYHGAYFINYPTGKPFEKGTYQYDQQDGILEVYNEDGTLLRKETFLLGARNGKTLLYSKGVKTKEFNFWVGSIIE